MFSWPGPCSWGLQIRLAQSAPGAEPPGRGTAAGPGPVSLLVFETCPVTERIVPDWLWAQRLAPSPLRSPQVQSARPRP